MSNSNQSNQQAVVMAGGQGSRLRPITSNQPKPMVPVANKPMMEYIIDLLKLHQFDDIVVTLQFLPTVISEYFGDGLDRGVNMRYVIEDTPLGTAGSVRNAYDMLEDTFMVISGDALTDINLTEAIKFHEDKKSSVTIVLKKVPDPLEFGLVITDEDGRIVRFLEKPGWGEVFTDTINTGIYIIKKKVLELVPTDEPFDFSHDLFPILLEKEYPLYGFVADGYWCDVGNHDQYLQAHQDILDGQVNINIPGHLMEKNIWIGDGVEIDEGAVIKGPVIIGDHGRVENGSKLKEYTVLGDNVVVKQDTTIERSVIIDNSYIGSSCHVSGSIIGRNCDIKPGARINEGVVIGDDCQVGDNAIIKNNVLIYPFKMIDAHATITTNLIWGTRGIRSLFGTQGISGLVNVDITPEKAVRLGMAYGSLLPLNARVVTSRSTTRSARMIKRAIMAGLNASGVHIRDLEVCSVPVNRFTIQSHNDQGGVDIRTNSNDAQFITIHLFDEDGMDLGPKSQRKLEALFNRNDFRRAFPGELGEIYFPARALETYVHALEENIEIDPLRDADFKVVVDYGHGASALILTGLIKKLECEVLSLNAYTDEGRISATKQTKSESLRYLSNIVVSFSGDLGLLFDNGAERLSLVDDKGNIIEGSDLLITMVELVTLAYDPPGPIAVTVDQPSVIERIAESRGFDVIRTRSDISSAMITSREENVAFFGDGDGGFIFPAFMPACDAIMALSKILHMTAKTGLKLSSITEAIRPYYTRSREVFIAWDNKGSIMREFLEKYQDAHIDTTDGIKIILDENRWILIQPDKEEPMIQLTAEGESEMDCHRILDEYEDQIKKLSTL